MSGASRNTRTCAASLSREPSTAGRYGRSTTSVCSLEFVVVPGGASKSICASSRYEPLNCNARAGGPSRARTGQRKPGVWAGVSPYGFIYAERRLPKTPSARVTRNNGWSIVAVRLSGADERGANRRGHGRRGPVHGSPEDLVQ